MLTEERRERIVAEVMKRRFLSIHDIVTDFDCSRATARRDLDILAALGRIQRMRGGAGDVNGMNVGDVTAIDQEPARDPFVSARQRIAIAAAGLIADGESIGLSGGKTTLELARCLRGRRIGVVTPAIDHALELAADQRTRVVLIGGVLTADSRELVGPLAEQMLAEWQIGTFFLAVDGISIESGVAIIKDLEAHLARFMAARARRVVVVADHTKIERIALTHVMPITGVDTFVTDASAPIAACEAMRQAGVQVITA